MSCPFRKVLALAQELRDNAVTEAKQDTQTYQYHVYIGGVYQHFKGGIYVVLGTATYTEDGSPLVLYRALSDTEAVKVYARPVSVFCSFVTIEGVKVPRFHLIREVM